MAEKCPEKFFKYLSDKLRLVEKKKKDADQFKTYLRQQALERMSNPSYSVIGDDPMDDDDVSPDAFSVANFGCFFKRPKWYIENTHNLNVFLCLFLEHFGRS